MRKKRILRTGTSLILTALMTIQPVVSGFTPSLPLTVYADEISARGGIWTGFASCESGAEGGRSAGSDHGHAYGIFQFDDRYTLLSFLGYCLSLDSSKYADFTTTYTKYKNSSSVVSSNSADTAALIQAWHNIYDADPEGFVMTQVEYFVASYYPECVSYCNSKGIDIESDDYSPVIRGTLLSIAIWAGNNGAKKVFSRFSSGMTEEEMLDICYSRSTAAVKGENKVSMFLNRWTNTQKTLAAQAYATWLNGGEIPTTESGDLLSMLGGVGILHGIDGGNYIDYIREWINKYPTLTTNFRKGGWNTDNKEWAMSLRNAGDFYEMYGIIGNGKELDLSIGTSGGLAIGDVSVNASNYEVPDNGGSMPIVYFSQGQGQPWSSLPFGGGNIASSGCSITSLAMVVSYLTVGTDRTSWVYPSDIRAMIASKTGNYNHFYVDGAGQSHGIMSAVAGYYGLRCSAFGSSGSTTATANAIVQSLASGKPVIMSCRPGEFTKSGHFIVLTGLTEDGYVVVNDPSHPDKSGKKYSASYLAGQGKAWWNFSN